MQGVGISSGIETFDSVFCGGGSAACVLANRLPEDPEISVSLVEPGEGGRNPYFHWPADLAWMTKRIASRGWSIIPQPNMKSRVLWYTQAKVIGGGSTIKPKSTRVELRSAMMPGQRTGKSTAR